MKKYVLVRISTGEDPLELDEVQVFTDKDAAQAALKQNYESIRESVKNYDIEEDELDLYESKYYAGDYVISIYDEMAACGYTIYKGCIKIVEER